MAQIDFVNYFPLLFWFIIFFCSFYVIIFMYIIPIFYTTLKIREFYLMHLIKCICRLDYLLEFLFLIRLGVRIGLFGSFLLNLGSKLVIIRLFSKYLMVENLKI
jgi:hypothetical protein